MGDHRTAGARTENQRTAGDHYAPDVDQRDVLRDQNRLRLGMIAV